jgi:aminoglycoside phosphotransferase family enzyme
MTQEQISSLVSKGEFPETIQERELIETHISWVIVCDQFVYKIKKPVQYSFLDFSTLALRKHFCEREIELNQRLTDNIYIDVQPISEWQGRLIMGGREGTITDYAVRMYKQDRDKQMDRLLLQNKVNESDIQSLAEKIALFHKRAAIIYKKDILDIQEKFNDLENEKRFLEENFGVSNSDIITHAVKTSDTFLEKNKQLLAQRLNAGYSRDCHGDLHSRNIFLLPEPQPFDCIEFNDDIRQIDVLNDVAFLCMDLDAFDRKDLSDLFIEYYNQFFPTIATDADRQLFVYFKSYRANIRAKVNSLRARSAAVSSERAKTFSAVSKYLGLMDSYLKSLEQK